MELQLFLIYALVPFSVYFILQSSHSHNKTVEKIIRAALSILIIGLFIPFHPIRGDVSVFYSVVDFFIREQHLSFALMALFYLLTYIFFIFKRNYSLSFVFFLTAFGASLHAIFTGDIGRSSFILQNYPSKIYWLATGIPLLYFVLPIFLVFIFATFIRYKVQTSSIGLPFGSFFKLKPFDEVTLKRIFNKNYPFYYGILYTIWVFLFVGSGISLRLITLFYLPSIVSVGKNETIIISLINMFGGMIVFGALIDWILWKISSPNFKDYFMSMLVKTNAGFDIQQQIRLLVKLGIIYYLIFTPVIFYLLTR